MDKKTGAAGQLSRRERRVFKCRQDKSYGSEIKSEIENETQIGIPDGGKNETETEDKSSIPFNGEEEAGAEDQNGWGENEKGG